MSTNSLLLSLEMTTLASPARLYCHTGNGNFVAFLNGQGSSRGLQYLDSVSEGSPGVASGSEGRCPMHESSMERAASINPLPFHPLLTTLKLCLQPKKILPKQAANPNSNDQHPRTRGTISFEVTALYTLPRNGLSSSVPPPMLQHAAKYQPTLTRPQL